MIVSEDIRNWIEENIPVRFSEDRFHLLDDYYMGMHEGYRQGAEAMAEHLDREQKVKSDEEILMIAKLAIMWNECDQAPEEDILEFIKKRING